MRCLWCNNSFSSWHATRMICHVLKFPKGGLGACTGIIPKERYKRYQDYHDQKSERKEGKKRGTDDLMTALTDRQESAAIMLASSHKK